MKYVVVESQTNKDGALTSIATDCPDRAYAENKYHTVLAAASASGLPKHACSMMSDEGLWIKGECYRQEDAAEA